MLKIKKKDKKENDSLNSLEKENSSQQRNSIFFTCSPLSYSFLQKK